MIIKGIKNVYLSTDKKEFPQIMEEQWLSICQCYCLNETLSRGDLVD